MASEEAKFAARADRLAGRHGVAGFMPAAARAAQPAPTNRYIMPQFVEKTPYGMKTQAASAAAILLASGTKGKRLMLPNARVLIHQPAIDQGFGKATEIEIQAKEMLRMREWLEETLAKHTGQDVEKIRRDIEVDTFLTAPEAKEYGIVDEVLEHRQ